MQLPAGFVVVSETTPFELDVYALVRAVPPGRVTSYGRLAELAGRPRRARAAGRAMARCPEEVPWHRVVNVRGRLVPGHEREQAQLLRAEGVSVVAGHVRLPIPWWDGAVTESEARSAMQIQVAGSSKNEL
ncbi:MAG TPA: MGMT family protein [Gaiellales bacterium]|nr:MGMT family protein [Gaiellales bacterium]